MPSILPHTYQLDLTGESENNFISSETLQLSNGNLRAVSPLYAPFFSAGLTVVDKHTGSTLASDQYRLMNLVPLLSAMSSGNKEVYSILVITDSSVSSSVEVSYQTVGGKYVRSYATVATLIETLLNDNRNYDPAWPSILNKDHDFEPSLHYHALGDVIGWEYVAAALDDIKTAIVLGDEDRILKVFAYISRIRQRAVEAEARLTELLSTHAASANNPHRVTKYDIGLGNVQNYPNATIQQALDGTNRESYLTPEIAKSAIYELIKAQLTEHTSDKNNPHGVTKEQIGLGNLFNYSTATVEETIAGTSVNQYVTPAGVKAAIDKRASDLVSKSLRGQQNGVVPLNPSGKIDAKYLEKYNVTTASNQYDIHQRYSGTVASNQTLLQVVAIRSFTLPAALAGSAALSSIAPTRDERVTLYKNDSIIGTIAFYARGKYGVFNFSKAVSFSVGDTFKVVAPQSTDGIWADITFAIAGTLT